MEVKELMDIQKRLKGRRQLRQLQAAKKGIDTNPEITMELQDLNAAIKAIDDLINPAIEQDVDFVDPTSIADTLREVNVIV